MWAGLDPESVGTNQVPVTTGVYVTSGSMGVGLARLGQGSGFASVVLQAGPMKAVLCWG